jgi:hypothetical protein
MSLKKRLHSIFPDFGENIAILSVHNRVYTLSLAGYGQGSSRSKAEIELIEVPDRNTS